MYIVIQKDEVEAANDGELDSEQAREENDYEAPRLDDAQRMQEEALLAKYSWQADGKRKMRQHLR